MSEIGDPLDSLPSGILVDVLGRVADTGDIAACRLASRALLAASYYCPRVHLSAAGRARRLRLREGGGGHGGTTFRAAAGNVASLLGPHLHSLALDASEEQGFPWEEGEGDGLNLTSGESVAAWAATAAGPTLQEVDIADFSPPSRWLKAEALPVISHFCHNLLKLRLRNAWLSVDGLKGSRGGGGRRCPVGGRGAGAAEDYVGSSSGEKRAPHARINYRDREVKAVGNGRRRRGSFALDAITAARGRHIHKRSPLLLLQRRKARLEAQINVTIEASLLLPPHAQFQV